ncbi:MAG: hypothetical protein N2Z70_06005, partial [Bdellovibrionaceae bacterium]|nr:hypothetical protein [Pseudobdellovibrionaceae bacterium]
SLALLQRAAPLAILGAEASGRKKKPRGTTTKEASFLLVFKRFFSKSPELSCYQRIKWQHWSAFQGIKELIGFSSIQ